MPERAGTGRESDRAFLAVAALLFAASAALTIMWSSSMAAMGGMPMPGGWTMSMAWMRAPGQSWPGAVAAFLGMWVVMMVAMMLPAAVPMLGRYRRAVAGTGRPRLGRLTLVAGAGYFVVWAGVGLVAGSLGFALAAMAMARPELARAGPVAGGMVVLLAGALQLTAWKAGQLAGCRVASEPAPARAAHAGPAWRHGLRLGLRCSQCCAGPTAVLLVLGVMDLRAMAVVAAAIAAERLAPSPRAVARALGVVGVAAGALLIAAALGVRP